VKFNRFTNAKSAPLPSFEEKADLEIRVKRLFREDFKTFKDYCREKWLIGKSYANYLISGSQVAVNLATAVALCAPCEIQPVHEQQVRPLRILEPAQQCEVWEEAVRTAPAGKVCHFRTPAISVSGGFFDETAETASGLVSADPWPLSQVTPAALPLGASFASRGGPVSGPVRRRFIFPGGGLGAHLRVPVSPAGEVLSSPQMLGEDIETIAGIFPGKVISVEHGKIAMLGSWAHVFFCEGVRVRFPLGTRPLLSWTPKSQF